MAALTSYSFDVQNANDSDRAALDQALLQLARSPEGEALMQGAADNSVKISIIHDGADKYVGGDVNTIYWDPKAGTTVITNPTDVDDLSIFYAGKSLTVGVQSAALGLVHEAAHAADPDFGDNVEIPDTQYQTRADRIAIEKENIVAADLGEP
jgi:hypothetical protein